MHFLRSNIGNSRLMEPSEKIEKGSGRLYALDLIKVIAIAIIACHHFQQDFGVQYQHLNFYGGRIYWGYLVELFFTISGFVTVISERKRRSEGIVAPMMHRIARVWPMAALSVVVFAAIDLCFLGYTGHWYLGHPLGIRMFVSSFFLVFSGWFAGMYGVNNPIWYLSVLLLCYLAFYVVRLLSRRTSLPTWVPCVVLVALGVAAQELRWQVPFLIADSSARGYASFFLGVLLGMTLPRVGGKRVVSSVALALFLLLVCRTILVGPLHGDEWATDALLLWPLLVTFAALSKTANRVCASRAVRYLGGLNYEFYVWHNVVLLAIAMACAVAHVGLPVSRVGMVAYLLAVLLVAHLMHRYAEGPLTEMAIRVAARFGIDGR